MSELDQDDESRPNSGDVYAMWRSLDVTVEHAEAPAVTAYLGAVEDECQARTAHGCLRLAQHPLITRYFDRLDCLEFGRMLLSTPAADTVLPEVLADARGPYDTWEEICPFVAGGLLAEHLNAGAGRPLGHGTRHMALGTAVITELIEDRYDDLAVWFNDVNYWSPWFNDAGWSAMWLIADRVTLKVHILCVAVDADPDDEPTT
jgi:hypothetical protein